MRYIPNQHIMVKSLVDHLKLAKKEFLIGVPRRAAERATCFTFADDT